MRNNNILLEQVEKVIHKYNQKEALKRDYGLGILLTRTEIHIIATIGNEPGIGVKKLAMQKCVTDGAISQMIRKLVQKNLIKKSISKESEAKVELTLTEKGQICYKEHKEYHIKANKKWSQLLDELDDQSYKKMKVFLNKVDRMLD